MKRYLMALAFLFSACVPQATQKEARPLLKETGFYPAATGLEWVYIPEGEALNSPPTGSG